MASVLGLVGLVSVYLAFAVFFFPGWVILGSDLETGTLLATVPATWCCGVSTGTGWPDVGIPGFCCRAFSGLSHIGQWLRNWYSAGHRASHTWCYGVSNGTGWPDVSIPGFCCGFFSSLSHTGQWLRNWFSAGRPASHLMLWHQYWDWLAWCQYTVTVWDSKFDLWFLS